jgi:hypothetical protein
VIADIKGVSKPGFYICYREGDGRQLAYAKHFDTSEAAQAKIDALLCQTILHVVEVK